MASKVQDCDCGFIDSNDPTQSVFNSFLAVDFSSITEDQFGDLFIPASYEISQSGSPYSRNYSTDQVQLSDVGLNLTVSPARAKLVPCAQVFTRRAAYFYGSYHAQLSVGSVPGTVTAFFNYKNDSSEIDIEYLSAWNVPTLLYSDKPQIYLDNGAPSSKTYQQQAWSGTPKSFDEGSHSWSFVWLPDRIHFGLDGKYSKVLTTNVPHAPGRLALSHWSDGNPNYSLGPPARNATATISSIWAVYNDTNATALTCKSAASACTVTNGIFQASNVPDGDNSNNTGIRSVSVVSSAHLIDPLAPSWLFVLFLFVARFSGWRSW